MTHNFTGTLRKNKSGQCIWRCERCDSEVAFDCKLSQRDVNQAVQIRWPKFVCAPNLIKQN